MGRPQDITAKKKNFADAQVCRGTLVAAEAAAPAEAEKRQRGSSKALRRATLALTQEFAHGTQVLDTTIAADAFYFSKSVTYDNAAQP